MPVFQRLRLAHYAADWDRACLSCAYRIKIGKCDHSLRPQGYIANITATIALTVAFYRAILILSGEPGELFANLAFKTSVCGVIIAGLCHLLREIFLPGGVGIGFVVGVAVFLPIPHLFHQFGRRIAQMNRHVIIRAFTGVGHGRFKGGIDSVTFRCAGQINNRLSDSTLAFSRPDAGKAVPGRNSHLHGARVGIPDIFRGNRQAATGHIQRIATGGDNAGIPVKRRIGRAAAHGLMQCRNQIVKPIAFIVETRAALPGDFGEQRRFQYPLAGRIHFGHIGHHFQRIECPAGVAVNQFSDRPARVVRQNDILPAVAARVIVHRLRENLFNILHGQGFEQVNTCAGKQRGIEFKRRVFGGGTDEENGAVFNVRQESILLAFIETVNFVDKENGTSPGIAVLPRTFNRLADLLHAGRDCRDALDIRVSIAGDNFRERGFACTGWAPEDHGVQMPGLNGTRQGFPRSQQVLLADVLR
ncbi:hypothetical protein EcWSU1_01480 [Enterobacter ludwigii]|uniref:Uncharacterized protein n=1 Tax=Enterobacter ludwigii TaxID=299767 RepID=G8LGZ5_9ENTR|nr:hypothetical protein EcWSU1_01480 [Enterobacter ludwigii]